ncbi:MAG: hypothetical protein R3E14_13180 [Erythrobacter sp.]
MSTPKPKTTLPAFTPVPRLKERSNGWKPEVQRAFIEALADTGSVAAACRMVRRSTHGAYHLRRQEGAEEFAAAWQAALDLGMQRIEDVAMDRALNGVEQPVYSYGKLVGTRVVHNDRLLMFMLRNRSADRFAEGRAKGMNALDKMELARLKKQWRKEWEKEWGAQQLERECMTIESINAKIDAMNERGRRQRSPEVAAAWEAYEDAVARDREEEYSPWHDPRHELYNPRLTGRGARISPYGDNDAPGESDAASDVGLDFPLYDTQEEADAAGIVFNGMLHLPPPPQDDPPAPTGPRLRTIKDDGWD